MENKKRINVLSLFDGISCGQIALERAGIPINNYFSSEIDKHAIKVTQHNYPSTIQLGDVLKVNASDLPKIDLLIGGSPCQGFSFAGKQLNFNDPRSALFFQYVRLLKECKPKYFFLENVKMKKEYQDIISYLLGVEPIEVNSALVSAQNRKRLYWTNIEGFITPEDRGIEINYISEDGLNYIGAAKRGRYNELNKIIQVLELNKSNKINALTTVAKDSMLYFAGKERNLTPIEREKAQNIPNNYTKILSDNKRVSVIGNAWTVDVIVEFFKNINK